MEAIQDFEDLLFLFHKHRVRYLIMGGLAFVYHAKPRYTKDMDIWIDPAKKNVERATSALAEFGIPLIVDPAAAEEILQQVIDSISKTASVDKDASRKTSTTSSLSSSTSNTSSSTYLIR